MWLIQNLPKISYKLRFKKPVPIKSWTEPLDGTQWPNKCIQIDNLGKMSAKIAYKQGKIDSYSEDCLYLNVWAPHPIPKNSPVMVSKIQIKQMNFIT